MSVTPAGASHSISNLQLESGPSHPTDSARVWPGRGGLSPGESESEAPGVSQSESRWARVRRPFGRPPEYSTGRPGLRGSCHGPESRVTVPAAAGTVTVTPMLGSESRRHRRDGHGPVTVTPAAGAGVGVAGDPDAGPPAGSWQWSLESQSESESTVFSWRPAPGGRCPPADSDSDRTRATVTVTAVPPDPSYYPSNTESLVSLSSSGPAAGLEAAMTVTRMPGDKLE
jgi:hypothetical protein